MSSSPQPPFGAISVAVTADGQVVAEIAAPVGKGSKRGSVLAGVVDAALLLDGTMRAMLRFETVAGGVRRAVFALPRHLLAAELDLIDAAGTSLLAWPVNLASAYGLSAPTLVLNGLSVAGGFAAAPWLADTIGVDVLDGGLIMGRGLARRTAGGWVGGGGEFAFSIPLTALPRLGREANLRLRVGGQVLPMPMLPVSQESLGWGGCIDGLTADHIAGWAINHRAAERPVDLDIVIDGVVVSRVVAADPREDLRAMGFATIAHGFTAALPHPADPTARRRIGVRFAGSQTGLAGSPLVLDPAPKLTGSFDRLHSTSAHGWALDHAHPGEKLVVEAVTAAGEVVGSAIASDFRGDLLQAGLAGGFCAFKIDFAAHYDRLLGQDLSVRVAGCGTMLPGSPKTIAQNPNFIRLRRRRHAIKSGVLPRLKRALNHRAGAAGISIIMPVFNPTRQWLVEALESVRTQWCDAWQLICVDDGSTAPHVQDVLRRYAKSDARIRVLTSAQNVGIARAVNFGLRAARYGLTAFMDHDDALEPDAVWQLLRAAGQTDADLLYSDEVLTGDNLNDFIEFRLRPAFSHDYYLSHPYFVHLVCVRTELARRVGGWNEAMAISADVDFVLRVIEEARVITHVPAVLYRWRTHAASAGHSKQDDVMAATLGAIQAHLDRLGSGGQAKPGVWFNQFSVAWPDPGGRVLVVIPTKNKGDLLRKAIDSIERTTPAADIRIVVIDHQSTDADTRAYLNDISDRHVVMPYAGPFNFSLMNNLAVRKHGADCDFVLFLNNDVEATQYGWIARLRSLAARPDVGAVGPLLMYEDHRVQHAGVILGFNNSADHALKFQDVWLDTKGRRNLGYNCSISSVRDFSAVTAACLMMRRAVFDRIGGFDEDFAIGFNDTDLCLRIGAAGYRVLYDGATMLYHYESATRADTNQVLHPEDTARIVARWGAKLAGGDPWYNPMLSLVTQDHVPREDKACRPIHPPRPQAGPRHFVVPDDGALAKGNRVNAKK